MVVVGLVVVEVELEVVAEEVSLVVGTVHDGVLWLTVRTVYDEALLEDNYLALSNLHYRMNTKLMWV